MRRIGHAATLFMDAGMIVLTVFVLPFRTDRDKVCGLVSEGMNDENEGHDKFIEVHCNADLTSCEDRDTNSLCAKARDGVMSEFTEISSPCKFCKYKRLHLVIFMTMSNFCMCMPLCCYETTT